MRWNRRSLCCIHVDRISLLYLMVIALMITAIQCTFLSLCPLSYAEVVMDASSSFPISLNSLPLKNTAEIKLLENSFKSAGDRGDERQSSFRRRSSAFIPEASAPLAILENFSGSSSAAKSDISFSVLDGVRTLNSSFSTLILPTKCSDHFFASSCLSFSSACNWCCDAPVGKQCFNTSEFLGAPSVLANFSTRNHPHPLVVEKEEEKIRDGGTISSNGISKSSSSLLHHLFANDYFRDETPYVGCSADARISNRSDSCAARCASFGRNCTACESHMWCLYCLEYNTEDDRETFSSLSSIQGVCQSPFVACKGGKTTQSCSDAIEDIPRPFVMQVKNFLNTVSKIVALLVLLVVSIAASWYAVRKIKHELPAWKSRVSRWMRHFPGKWWKRWMCADAGDSDTVDASNITIVEPEVQGEALQMELPLDAATAMTHLDTEREADSVRRERHRNSTMTHANPSDMDMLRNFPSSSLLMTSILSRDPFFVRRANSNRNTAPGDRFRLRASSPASTSNIENTSSVESTPSASFPGDSANTMDEGNMDREKLNLPLQAAEADGNSFGSSQSFLNSFELCCLCLESPATVTYLPCHHTCCCSQCSNRLRPSASSSSPERSIVCPLCRTTIDAMVSLPQIFRMIGSRA